jgi:geranylgeranyl pyrophosphate synthase
LISSFQIPLDLQPDIDLVERNMLAQADDYHPDLKAAVRVLISTGGKRIRPLVILLVSRMLKGPQEQIANLATAIELLHTATLVHDDLIDGSLLRRGVPTLNSKWSPAATVLTGDFLFSCAATIASRTQNLEVIELFSKTLTTIVSGEVNQLFTSRCNVSKDDYYLRIYAKTASLFETSTKSAAILNNANKEKIELLRNFGYCLGMAFQIIDDILDYTGEQIKIGKPVGGDLRQGLITLPMLFFIEDNPTDNAVIRLLEGKCITDDDDLDRVVKLVAKGSAIQKSHFEAMNFVTKAIECLEQFGDCPEKELLKSLTSYIVERTM